MPSLLIKIILYVFLLFSYSSAYGFVPGTFLIKDMEGLADYLLQGDQSNNGEGAVYQTIKKRFEDNDKKFGSWDVGKLPGNEKSSLQAGVNHIGLVYSSGFADFSVYLKRELAPDLFDDERYIVIDNFDIYIDAQKILKNLKKKNLIDITKAQFEAYGDISFKRSYRYIYFADSFEDALHFNLNKLFFAFDVLQNKKYLEMNPYEVISREDGLTVGMGGRIRSPNAEFGSIAEFHRLSKLEIQAVGPEDQAFEDEKFRLSFEKKRGKNLMKYAALSIDFLNLMRLAFFQKEFSYEYMDEYRVNLSFKEEDVEKIKDDNSFLGQTIQNVIQTGFQDIKTLKPYLVSEEVRKTERKKSRYTLLLRGKSKECQTTEVSIVKDNKVRKFFRHTFGLVQYRENFISKLFSTLLNSFLKMDGFATSSEDDYHGRSVCMEYESDKNLLDGKEKLALENAHEKFSLKFEETFYLHEPKGKTRDRCVAALKSCPGVDSEAIEVLEKGKIKSNMKISTNYILNKGAIEHFNQKSIAEIYYAIHVVCNKVQKRDHNGDIIEYKKRNRSTKKCEEKLQYLYDGYYKALIRNKYTAEDYRKCDQFARKYGEKEYWLTLVDICLHRNSLKANPLSCSLPLWHLRNFADSLSHFTNKKEDMYAFFGIENVFFHGYLKGITDRGQYKACFKDGNFSGTGLIDNHLREEKIRSKSLLILE